MDLTPESRSQNRTHQAIDRMSEKAHETVDRLADSAGPAADWLKGSGSKLKDAQQKMMSETSDYIREHPLTAIAGAIAAGFLIGKITQIRTPPRQ